MTAPQDLTCWCYGPFPTGPHTPDHEDCHAQLFIDEVEDWGQCMDLELAVEAVSEYGYWHEAIKWYFDDYREDVPTAAQLNEGARL